MPGTSAESFCILTHVQQTQRWIKLLTATACVLEIAVFKSCMPRSASPTGPQVDANFQHDTIRASVWLMTRATLHVNSLVIHLRVNPPRAILVLA